ncbi:MAG: CU044_5270 family protein [Acidothermaceae bacterium]
MSDITEVRDLLNEHDPLAQNTAPLDDLAVERMWRTIVSDIESGAQPQVRPPARHEPKLVRSAVAAIVVAACVLGGLVIANRQNSPSASHYVALRPLNYSRNVDPTPAGPTLAQLAAVAKAQPTPVSSGVYYLETASWSTFTGSDASDLPPGMPNVLEQWVDTNGAERIVNHVDLPAPAAGLQAWLNAGLPLTGGRAEERTATAAQRQFPDALSTDPAILEQQLLQAERGSSKAGGPPTTAELFTALKDLRAAQPVDPPLQAALLQMLANQQGIVSLGTATDRLGRVVDAIALDSGYSGLPTRYVLLFDPTDGKLLGSEDVLTKSAGSLNVPIPSVISYVIYVRDGHVRDDTSSPPPL